MRTYRCGVCRKTFEWDGGAPLCTGPSESSDDHEQTLMVEVKVPAASRPAIILPKGYARG